jgi:hypothetical protein
MFVSLILCGGLLSIMISNRNKDTATKMQCFMQLLLMKAQDANRGRGMGALDASPIEDSLPDYGKRCHSNGLG